MNGTALTHKATVMAMAPCSVSTWIQYTNHNRGYANSNTGPLKTKIKNELL